MYSSAKKTCSIDIHLVLKDKRISYFVKWGVLIHDSNIRRFDSFIINYVIYIEKIHTVRRCKHGGVIILAWGRASGKNRRKHLNLPRRKTSWFCSLRLISKTGDFKYSRVLILLIMRREIDV